MESSKINYAHTISVADYNFLRKAVGWNEIPENQAQIGINNSAYLVSAIFGDKVIGMARVVSDGGHIVMIVDVMVLPEYQGYGVGKTMMGRVMQWIETSMNEGETVFINLMAVKGREPFYKPFGFIERPNGSLGAGMTQWIKK